MKRACGASGGRWDLHKPDMYVYATEVRARYWLAEVVLSPWMSYRRSWLYARVGSRCQPCVAAWWTIENCGSFKFQCVVACCYASVKWTACEEFNRSHTCICRLHDTLHLTLSRVPSLSAYLISPAFRRSSRRADACIYDGTVVKYHWSHRRSALQL